MISVCIATYNGAKYIRRQLESILGQLSENDEIVISDDGSKDDTIEIIKSINSPLIRIIRNEGKHGYTPNFENALNFAKGDYIFLADQDDIWRNDKVSKTMILLEKYDFVVSDAIVVDEKMNVISESYFSLRKPYFTFCGNMLKFGFLGCCMAFRRNILSKALPFPHNHILCTHDNWLQLVAMLYYKAKISDEKMLLYCRHEGTTSNAGLQNKTSVWFKLKYRFYLACYLFIRICK